MVLNGIASVATRPDLVDRTVHIEAPPIAVGERRVAGELAAQWAADWPKVLGALLELFSKALGFLDGVVLETHQRMADFERLGEAVMRAQGAAPGTFSMRYAQNVEEGSDRAIENFGVATAVLALSEREDVVRKGKWSGLVGVLYQQLETYKKDDNSNWPDSPRGLSDQLKRLTPALRRHGVTIAFGAKTRKGRRVTISRK